MAVDEAPGVNNELGLIAQLRVASCPELPVMVVAPAVDVAGGGKAAGKEVAGLDVGENRILKGASLRCLPAVIDPLLQLIEVQNGKDARRSHQCDNRKRDNMTLSHADNPPEPDGDFSRCGRR